MTFLSLVLATILTFASTTPTVSLVADPLSGPAPLDVSFVISIEGPYSGPVCMAFEKASEPGDVRTLSCEMVEVAGDTTENIEHDLSGGTAGETYKFYAFLAAGDSFVVSDPVTIEVK
jgi:hypothetical protein